MTLSLPNIATIDRGPRAEGPEPADSWAVCPKCRSTVYRPRLARNLQVCPECGYHHRIGAEERLRQLIDDGSFRPTAHQVASADPLGFVDSRPYPVRLAQARRQTGLSDAALSGTAMIGGVAVEIVVMDFRFLGGSMGSAVGETVVRAAEQALERQTPLIIVTTSGGARMQEGCLSLMQMAKTGQALRRLQQAGVLSVCVLTDPTFGGVTASFATLADILVAEQGSLIGFAGPRVIAAATRQRLPDGFQTAEYLWSKGMLDRVESRRGLRPLLIRLLAMRGPGAAADDTVSPLYDMTPPVGGSAGRNAWETVKRARDIRRPTTLDYIQRICDDFVELHGDRHHGDDAAIVGGFASIDGLPVVIIGHQKGHDTGELVARNFGMPQPEGYRKAIRLMRLADRQGVPVVTFVDTQGAAPGVAAEERGQAWAIADCIASMSELGVPTVATILGEGGSGGAVALAVANRVLMMENACYSVISPESCSTILHGDPSRGAEMATALRITAPELLALGVVDTIVEEPADGAQAAPAQMADRLKAAVLDALRRLSGLDPDELRKNRYERFRSFGVVIDV